MNAEMLLTMCITLESKDPEGVGEEEDKIMDPASAVAKMIVNSEPATVLSVLIIGKCNSDFDEFALAGDNAVTNVEELPKIMDFVTSKENRMYQNVKCWLAQVFVDEDGNTANPCNNNMLNLPQAGEVLQQSITKTLEDALQQWIRKRL
jgi:hypothetical protein